MDLHNTREKLKKSTIKRITQLSKRTPKLARDFRYGQSETVLFDGFENSNSGLFNDLEQFNGE